MEEGVCRFDFLSLACAEFANNTASLIEAQFNPLLTRYLIDEGSLSFMIFEIPEMCSIQVFVWAIRS